MPWQRQVLDVALEKLPGRGVPRLAYRQVILTVPRQSGKTQLLLVLILLRALGIPRQNIKYTAQTGGDARDKWTDDWLPVLEASEFSSQFKTRKTNGHEALLFNNGSRQGLVATTKKSGHGGVLDLGILDESFAHPDGRLEQALSPAMNTRKSPQLWVVSTAGTPDDSPYLLEKVEKGREMVEAGVQEGTAYFEWSAEDGADPGDEDVWWSCMPALGHTTPIDAVRAEYEKLSISEFRRAYLNQWVGMLTDPVISTEQWRATTDLSAEPVGITMFALDVDPDRSHASIGVAGRRDDGAVVVKTVDSRGGLDWVAERLPELDNQRRPAGWVIDVGGPAATFITPMRDAGFNVIEATFREVAQASEGFYDGIVEGSTRHTDDPILASAVAGAARRPYGDSWVWGRRVSSCNITPLVAASLARWGFLTRADELTPEDIYVG